MQEPVFEQEIEEPVFTHVYEENEVLYCASSTSEGVYWYTYALNNPLRFTDPSGYTYDKPSPLERERRDGPGYYYNYEMDWKMAGLAGSQFSPAQRGPGYAEYSSWAASVEGNLLYSEKNQSVSLRPSTCCKNQIYSRIC